MPAGTGVELHAEDWPQWRGADRRGVWTETGIVETFPQAGLQVDWRVPVHEGYAGPAVAEGRVFVVDARHVGAYDVVERIVCIDELSGDVLWEHEWEANYTGLSSTWATGPRATPTVDGDRVYALGATGMLRALRVDTGELLWTRNYVEEYDTEIPTWGIAGAPLVDGERLIALVGGAPNAKVVAFDKLTGAEIWRALPSDSEPGYSQPMIIDCRRRPAAHHLASGGGGVPGPGERGGVLGAAGPRGRGHERRHPRAQRPAPVRIFLLQRFAHARPQPRPSGSERDVEEQRARARS